MKKIIFLTVVFFFSGCFMLSKKQTQPNPELEIITKEVKKPTGYILPDNNDDLLFIANIYDDTLIVERGDDYHKYIVSGNPISKNKPSFLKAIKNADVNNDSVITVAEIDNLWGKEFGKYLTEIGLTNKKFEKFEFGIEFKLSQPTLYSAYYDWNFSNIELLLNLTPKTKYNMPLIGDYSTGYNSILTEVDPKNWTGSLGVFSALI